MSRKSAGDQMAEDAAAGCIFVIFLALWAAIAGLVVGNCQRFADQPGRPVAQNGNPTGVRCPDCWGTLSDVRRAQ